MVDAVSRVPTSPLIATLYRIPLGLLVFVAMAVQFAHSAGSADWDPYPFVDVATKGYLSVALSCIGIAALFLALSWAVVKLGDLRAP